MQRYDRGPKNLNMPCGPTTTILGWFVIRELGLAMNNLPTKCEVSISAHHEDMKGVAKL